MDVYHAFFEANLWCVGYAMVVCVITATSLIPTRMNVTNKGVRSVLLDMIALRAVLAVLMAAAYISWSTQPASYDPTIYVFPFGFIVTGEIIRRTTRSVRKWLV